MKKIGIFYGSSTGMTADAGRQIARALGVADSDIHDVSSTAPSKVGDYDVIICGTSTWANGNMQDSWMDFVAGVEAMDLRGMKVALYGTGDDTMTDTFCDGVGRLYKRLQKTGAEFIGEFNTDGYSFNRSEATDPATGMAVGLLLDDVNHADMTADRISAWCTILGEQM